MRKMLFLIPMLCSSAAIAQTGEPAPSVVAAPATPPVPEKKVCRSEPQLGSIMTKRTCHTRAEWASIDAANRANVERIRDQAGSGSPRN